MRRTDPEKLSPGLAASLAYKLRTETLRAEGLSTAQISNQLFAAGKLNFPYAAHPNLPSSGNPKTLTILVDFADHRAADEFPGLTVEAVQRNIYGPAKVGPDGHSLSEPYEGVTAYYERASEGKLHIQGKVLGWYHFPKNRDAYTPIENDDMSMDEKWDLENKTLLAMYQEALTALAATEDLTPYDNDSDGFIDSITMLYTGPHPNSNWGTFWWAYHWDFYDPETGPTFGSKNNMRLKGFIFAPIDVGPPGEFKPAVLLHEVGHALGLPDYYYYAKGNGLTGGVGGLDMMDDEWGNHNAFSRWLLDWIEPEIIGSGEATPHTLNASGSPLHDHKAITIFPGLSPGTAAPAQELYMIENRFPMGNDGGVAHTPGSGLLVWHINATPIKRADGRPSDDFQFNNSDTTPKLIRLVRADTAVDFVSASKSDACNTWAEASTYFNAPSWFGTATVPSSRAYDGSATHVLIDNISPAAETMSLSVGFESSGIAQAPDVISSTAKLSAPTPATPADVVDLAALNKSLENYRVATAAEMKKTWEDYLHRSAAEKPGRRSEVEKQLILTQWAWKDGPAASQAVLGLPAGSFSQEAFARVMETWANQTPATAATWYFNDANLNKIQALKLNAGTKFAETVFYSLGQSNFKKAVSLLDRAPIPELGGALKALTQVAGKFKMPPDLLEKELGTLKTNRILVEAIRHPQTADHVLQDDAVNATEKQRLRDFLLLQRNLPQ